MATISVNEKGWSGLSAADKEQITEIMRSTGLIASGDVLEAAGKGGPEIKSNPLCILGCNAAQAVAIGACASLSGPAAAVCIATAPAAGDYCRSRC